MPALGDDFFRVESLTFSHPNSEKLLFEDATFACGASERLGIVSDNGTGKSTLIRILCGLTRVKGAKISCFSLLLEKKKDWERVRREVGVVLQNPDDQLFFPEVIEDVMFGPMNLGLSRQQAESRAKEVLDELSISDLAHQDSMKLSGGQKRLVSLACVLAMRPQGLILDEPNTGLDRDALARLTEILLRFPGPQIIVSHDGSFLEKLCTRLVTIQNGKFASPNPNSDPTVSNP